MISDAVLVYVILAITILLFVSEKLRLDLVALLALLALSLSGILTLSESLAGFSDPLVVMIAGLFVVAGAIFRTGLAERFGMVLGRIAGTGRARITAVLMLGTGLLSAFVSTTGTVALMLPVTVSLARKARLSPSLLLLPMAIGALLGGMLTLIATPPNLIVSNQLSAAGFEPFHFFDFTPVGLLILGVGTAVMVLIGQRLLPSRAPVELSDGSDSVSRLSGTDIVSGHSVGRIVRLRVSEGSPLVGVSPATASLRERFDVNVIGVRRPRGRGGRLHWLSHASDEPLCVGDELEVHEGTGDVDQLCATQALELVAHRGEPDAVLAEVLLTPRSRLIGQNLTDVRFRSRYGVNVLSIRRLGGAVKSALATVPLRFADTLLVAGSPKSIDLLRGEAGDFVVVSRTREALRDGPLSRREMLTLAIMLGMLVLLTWEIVPPAVAVLMAAVSMVLTRCLDMTAAYREINWESVILIAAILPMATALQKTGGIDMVVGLLQPIGDAGPVAMLAALFLLTGVMGQFISNTATAALVAPVAMSSALQMGVSPYPLLMTVAVAASTSFATPIATPGTMLVLGPGSYKFSDYARVGVPLQLVCGVLTVLVVPLLFPF